MAPSLVWVTSFFWVLLQILLFGESPNFFVFFFGLAEVQRHHRERSAGHHAGGDLLAPWRPRRRHRGAVGGQGRLGGGGLVGAPRFFVVVVFGGWDEI